MHHDHLTAETVADHLEGLLGPGEAAEAERHLAICPECSALREDLGRLRAALASHSTVPMPASVAARIDVALAEAAEARAAAGLSADGRSPSDREQTGKHLVRPAADESIGGRRAGPVPRRRRWLPVLGGALATIAIVLGTLAVLPRLTSSHGGGSQVATAGGAEATGTAGGSKAEVSPGPNAAANGYDSAASARVVSSGRAYTAYTLSAGVRDLLAEQDTANSLAAAPQQGGIGASPASPAPSDSRSANSGGQFTQLTRQAALTACIQSLVKNDVVPIVVDLATYGGKPAAIIVLPDPADSSSAIVYVVGPGCGPGESTPIATTTVRRPMTVAPSPNNSSGTQSAAATPPSP
jgi:anti-sigma factor RsiW